MVRRPLVLLLSSREMTSAGLLPVLQQHQYYVPFASRGDGSKSGTLSARSHSAALLLWRLSPKTVSCNSRSGTGSDGWSVQKCSPCFVSPSEGTPRASLLLMSSSCFAVLSLKDNVSATWRGTVASSNVNWSWGNSFHVSSRYSVKTLTTLSSLLRVVPALSRASHLVPCRDRSQFTLFCGSVQRFNDNWIPQTGVLC